MEKVSLPFFYDFGSQLGPLARMQPTATKVEIIIAAYNVRVRLNTLLRTFPLSVSRAKGEELDQAIAQIQQNVDSTEKEKGPDWWNTTPQPR